MREEEITLGRGKPAGDGGLLKARGGGSPEFSRTFFLTRRAIGKDKQPHQAWGSC